MKFLIGKNGFVVNIVSAPPAGADGKVPAPSLEEGQLAWLVADADTTAVGAAFDDKARQVDDVAVAIFQVLFRHENMIRQLVSAVRTNAGINTAAKLPGFRHRPTRQT